MIAPFLLMLPFALMASYQTWNLQNRLRRQMALRNLEEEELKRLERQLKQLKAGTLGVHDSHGGTLLPTAGDLSERVKVCRSKIFTLGEVIDSAKNSTLPSIVVRALNDSRKLVLGPFERFVYKPIRVHLLSLRISLRLIWRMFHAWFKTKFKTDRAFRFLFVMLLSSGPMCVAVGFLGQLAMYWEKRFVTQSFWGLCWEGSRQKCMQASG